MLVTEVTAGIERPEDDGSWNWAEAATDAWLAEAQRAGFVVEAADYEPAGGSVAVRVRVAGTWYAIEVGRRRTGVVHAVPLATLVARFTNEGRVLVGGEEVVTATHAGDGKEWDVRELLQELGYEPVGPWVAADGGDLMLAVRE